MLNNLLALMKCILDFMLFFWFSTLFFDRRRKGRDWLTAFVLILFALILNAVNLLHIPLLNTLVTFTFALLINLLLCTGPVKPRIICAAGEVLLVMVCEFIPIFAYSLIQNTSMRTLGAEPINNAGLNLISTCIFSMATLGIRHAAARNAQKEDGNTPIPENLAILAVPLVSILTVYHIVSYDATASSLTLQNLILFLGILCMNAAVIIGDDNSRKQLKLQRELDRLNRLEQLNHVVIDQQDQFIQQMKGFAHDYTSQLEGIKKLVQAGDPSLSKDIDGYTDQMLGRIEENCRFAFIPSPALRTILIQAQLRCNACHIKFDTDIQYGDFSFLAFPDLYTLFENPLENAIRACREMEDAQAFRYIRLRIFKNKDLIWVEIKNPKANAIIVKKSAIQTTKKDAAAHGLGLKNMKRAMERYNGYLNIDYNSSEFTVTMAFPVMGH